MKQDLSSLIRKEWSTTKALRGFLLVEIILSSSLFVILLTAFVGVFYYGQQASILAGNKSRAVMYAEEGQEAVRSMKNVNFSSLANGTYGLTYSNNTWNFSGSSDTQGQFTRQVVVSTVDANRKKVDVTVSWQQTPVRAASVTLSSRLTNWKTPHNLGLGLMVNKVVINHGLSKTTSDFAPYKVGTTTVTLGTSTRLPAGTYTVTETTNSNYVQTFSGDCNSSGQVTLTSSSSKICTITNEEKLAYIYLTGSVINHGGGKTTADFAPYKVGNQIVPLNSTTTIDSGTYSITEASSSEYALTYSGGCFTNGTITLLSGDSKTCMLTNEEIVSGGGGGSTSLAGLIIYGDGTNVPKYRTFNQNDNTFGAETATFTATVGPTWLIRTAPNAHIALAGYYDSTGTLTIMCFDGTTWTSEFAAASGGVGNRHRFDIAFEKSTGDALVFYSKGGSGPGDTARWGKLGFRTKSGATGCGSANWSNESIYTPQRTSNDIMYVKLASDRRATSTLIAATWVDTSDDISAAIWNGSSFVNEPGTVSDTSVQNISSGHDIEDMDVEYESNSGDVMLVWGNSSGNNGTSGFRYRKCVGGTSTCTWGSTTNPAGFLDDATTLDISANPNTNEMAFASIGKTGSDLQLGYWSGSAWTATANADTSAATPYVASKLVATGWVTLASTTRSVVVYSDSGSNNLAWYLGNGGTFTRQTDFAMSPTITRPYGYVDIHMNPRSQDQIMFVFSDSASDLYAKRLLVTGTSTPVFTWTNSDGGALETSLPQIISSPFSFAFWQQ